MKVPRYYYSMTMMTCGESREEYQYRYRALHHPSLMLSRNRGTVVSSSLASSLSFLAAAAAAVAVPHCYYSISMTRMTCVGEHEKKEGQRPPALRVIVVVAVVATARNRRDRQIPSS